MSLFVAVGHNGQRVVSENGADWKNLQLGKEGEVYRAVAFGAGVHVAVGNFGGSNLFAATRDGAAWKAFSKDGQYKFFLRAVAFGWQPPYPPVAPLLRRRAWADAVADRISEIGRAHV